MEISESLVRHLEALARLELEPEERQAMHADLRRILDYVDQLDALDTAGVQPTAQVIVQDHPLREDEIQPSLPREQGLAAAPRQAEGFFVVPPVLGSEEEDRA